MSEEITNVFSPKEASKLKGVDPALIKVVIKAKQLAPKAFKVTEGLRTLERQKKLLAEGKTTTLKSKHLIGRAIDLVALKPDGDITWDMPAYAKLNDIMQQAAKEVGVKIEWGGGWRKFKDGPHFQLS